MATKRKEEKKLKKKKLNHWPELKNYTQIFALYPLLKLLKPQAANHFALF